MQRFGSSTSSEMQLWVFCYLGLYLLRGQHSQQKVQKDQRNIIQPKKKTLFLALLSLKLPAELEIRENAPHSQTRCMCVDTHKSLFNILERKIPYIRTPPKNSRLLQTPLSQTIRLPSTPLHISSASRLRLNHCQPFLFTNNFPWMVHIK